MATTGWIELDGLLCAVVDVCFFFFFFLLLVSNLEVNSGGAVDYKITEAKRTGVVIYCPCVGV